MENDLLARLKLIGCIKQGHKLNTKKLYIQEDNIVSRISRTFLNIDDRENTLNFIITTIDKTFSIIDKLKNRLEQICEDIKNAIEGIKSLKKTYSDDLYFNCKVDVLIEDTENRLNKLLTTYGIKQIFPIKEKADIEELN